jgi:hypothetical protein
MLVGAGFVLCWSRASVWLRVGATALTAVLLGAKALVACRWAFDALHNQAVFIFIHPEDVFLVLMALLVVPSGVWALILAGTAAVVSEAPPDVLGTGTGNETGSVLTKPPWPWKRARFWGVLALALAVLLAGMARLWMNSLPASVTATQMLTAYRDNPADAEAKYKDKWLQVTGRVADNKTTGDFAPGSAITRVTLKADDPAVPGEVTIRVPGEFLFQRPAGSSSEDFRKLTKGQQVTIRGRCGGKTAPWGLTIESPSIVK